MTLSLRGRRSFVVVIVIVAFAAGLAVSPIFRTNATRVAGALHRRMAVLTHRAPPRLRIEIVRSYAHDPGAFTEGLALDGGVVYESTGLAGKSSVRRVDLQSGRVLTSVALAQESFGEGLALMRGRVIQLTWKEQTAFVYDARTLDGRGRRSYSGEGWGLCFDGQALVMSDGSDRLTFRDPESFAVQRTVDVTQQGLPLGRLNELECVGGSVYANVWRTDTIVRIDSGTGRVLETIDASGLLTPAERRSADVLNGIAYDPADATFLLTGKLWPKIFRVRFMAAAPSSPGGAR